MKKNASKKMTAKNLSASALAKPSGGWASRGDSYCPSCEAPKNPWDAFCAGCGNTGNQP